MGATRLIRRLYKPPADNNLPQKTEDQKKDVSLPYIYYPPQILEKINSDLFIQQLIK